MEQPPFRVGDRVRYNVPRGFADMQGKIGAVSRVTYNANYEARLKWVIQVDWDDRSLCHLHDWAYWALESCAPLTPFHQRVQDYITRELNHG